MLCVPLTSHSKKEIRTFLSAANKHADCIELRLDYFRRKPDLRKLLAVCKIPVIVTVRKKTEGGKYGLRYKDRLDLYLDAIQMNVAYVDIELSSPGLLLACQSAIAKYHSSTQLIVSYHNFRSTDKKQLSEVYERMKRIPRAILKMATFATSIEDNALIFALLQRAKRDRRAMIALCMGDLGRVSRILGVALGSLLTYAALGKGSAPGQLLLREMKELYRVDVLKKPAIFGLVGNPVKQSTGYLFHNKQFAKKRENAVYVNFLVEDVGSFLTAFRPFFSGLSVTVPHKEVVVNYLDYVDTTAKKIGAVNTIINKQGRLTGYNTDHLGISASLKGISLRGKYVLVLGAGGVARATCHALRLNKAKVSIVNRTHSKAMELAQSVGAEAVPVGTLIACPPFDLIVNCTSVGMVPKITSSPLTKAILKQISTTKTMVFDTIYTPAETRLLRHASSLGLNTITGVTLFKEQALAQYQLWGNVL